MQWCRIRAALSDTGEFPSLFDFPSADGARRSSPLQDVVLRLVSACVWLCVGCRWLSLLESLPSSDQAISLFSVVAQLLFVAPSLACGTLVSCCPCFGGAPNPHVLFSCPLDFAILSCKTCDEISSVSVKLTCSQFRAYTDPLTTTTTSNQLNPPSVPPPPPPPPLNVPPSRARMAFAARLASKRKAEEGGSPPDDQEERGLGKGGMSALMQRSDGAIRNPFADDEDDEGSEDEGSDDEEDGDLGAASGGTSSSWNRGGWWRGALGSKKQSKMSSEKFGDGRDSDDEEEEGEGEGGANSSEDEEFGDFALPEGQSDDAAGGVDAESDNVLVKPLPVHPAPGAAGASGGNKGLMGLWPFTKKDKDKEGDEAAGSPEAAEGEHATESEEAEQKTEATEAAEEPPVVLSEDGEKVQPTVEAKRRTSIEEPDEGEDEEVVV